jgi:cobalamin-dependent methionine synthase I
MQKFRPILRSSWKTKSSPVQICLSPRLCLGILPGAEPMATMWSYTSRPFQACHPERSRGTCCWLGASMMMSKFRPAPLGRTAESRLSPRQMSSCALRFPRQREGRQAVAVSDFFAPRLIEGKPSGNDGRDWPVAGHDRFDRASVSRPSACSKAGEYTKYLYLHGLSVETAEALAEVSITRRCARNWAWRARTRRGHPRSLFHQKYRGIALSRSATRPAPTSKIRPSSSPCCNPEENVGVRLTTGFLLEPEQSTSAMVAHHPAAKYFVV